VGLDLKHRLTHLGYDVPQVVASGQQALEAVARTRPDLILMDIMLGEEMDGIEAAGLVNAEYDIPVIYVTAYADEETMERAKVTEPFGYIIKPIEDRELNIAVEMALYKHQAERRLQEKERLLSTTLNSLGDGLLTLNQEAVVQFVNPEAEVLLRLHRDNLLGRRLTEVLSLEDPDTGEQYQEHLRQALETGQSLTLSGLLLATANKGSQIPVRVSLSPIMEDLSCRGGVLMFRDISDRLEYEQALRKSLTQLRTTLDETVNALAATGEQRDLYTAGHQRRVASLAVAIGRDIGLSSDRIDGLKVAGRLHDIGKINVPSAILAKPARLTSMEFAIIQGHSETGREILSGIPFPWPVADIVHQHHERLNGKGYPLGLTGDDILLESRILAVADVVEAMSSHRPYRAALGVEMALAEIQGGAGDFYDTRVVDSCVRLFHKRGFSFDEEKLQKKSAA
jgi:PAS domain S-box-containing protein